MAKNDSSASSPKPKLGPGTQGEPEALHKVPRATGRSAAAGACGTRACSGLYSVEYVNNNKRHCHAEGTICDGRVGTLLASEGVLGLLGAPNACMNAASSYVVILCILFNKLIVLFLNKQILQVDCLLVEMIRCAAERSSEPI